VQEWSVSLDLAGVGFTPEAADELVEPLKRYHAALTLGGTWLGVILTLRAPTAARALERAVHVTRKAIPRAGRVIAAEVQTVEEQERRLMRADWPSLVGVAEVAALLRVSKQRASVLARSRGFPRPVARLRSGPIWKRATVEHYAKQRLRPASAA
jgi:hypothetical protein